jgi:hypothetical protein
MGQICITSYVVLHVEPVKQANMACRTYSPFWTMGKDCYRFIILPISCCLGFSVYIIVSYIYIYIYNNFMYIYYIINICAMVKPFANCRCCGMVSIHSCWDLPMTGPWHQFWGWSYPRWQHDIYKIIQIHRPMDSILVSWQYPYPISLY